MCCFRRIRRLLKASVNSIPQVFGMNNRKIPFPSFSKPILINPKAFDIIKCGDSMAECPQSYAAGFQR
ncbi:MAG TPA: hypothetical protein DEF33_02030 [Clostridiales bacterium]|nr:hypothetical protein [Clostridiales bacterium]